MLLCRAIGVPVWLTIANRVHADLHVEPFVAVDDVVAALTHEDIAAIAAKYDIAGGEAW